MASNIALLDTVARYVEYQKERFPLATYVPMIALLSGACLSFSAALSGSGLGPSWSTFAAISGAVFIFFLLLRIADEFKDLEDDLEFRPYRAVPRGLVTLKELGAVAAIGIAVQVVLAISVDPALAVLLVIVLAYLGLMTKEFFAHRWLKAHPLIYLTSHMVILPLIATFASAGDWLLTDVAPPSEIALLALSIFLIGIVLELGRKIRAPEDEEPGVETYSTLWGGRRASSVWLGMVVASAASAVVTAKAVGAAATMAAALSLPVLLATTATIVFARAPRSATAKWFEHLSGLVALVSLAGIATTATLRGTV